VECDVPDIAIPPQFCRFPTRREAPGSIAGGNGNGAGFQTAHSQAAAAAPQQAKSLSPFVVTLEQMIAAPEKAMAAPADHQEK
jgi:hypothetical protein